MFRKRSFRAPISMNSVIIARGLSGLWQIPKSLMTFLWGLTVLKHRSKKIGYFEIHHDGGFN